MTDDQRPRITAYRIGPASGWSLAPASPRRDWMDRVPDRGAYRCLPMTVANQAAWVIACPGAFTALWDGGTKAAATTITLHDPALAGRVISHFGSGVITFHIPWLFRTSPGWALLVRGAANFVKDNCAPLEGLVETDWAPYTFTMNWKITSPGRPVRFEKGDPVCALLPVRPADLEAFSAEERDLASNPDLAAEFAAFKQARAAGIATYAEGNKVFQRMYTEGRLPAAGSRAQTHRTTIRLPDFA